MNKIMTLIFCVVLSALAANACLLPCYYVPDNSMQGWHCYCRPEIIHPPVKCTSVNGKAGCFASANICNGTCLGNVSRPLSTEIDLSTTFTGLNEASVVVTDSGGVPVKGPIEQDRDADTGHIALVFTAANVPPDNFNVYLYPSPASTPLTSAPTDWQVVDTLTQPYDGAPSGYVFVGTCASCSSTPAIRADSNGVPYVGDGDIWVGLYPTAGTMVRVYIQDHVVVFGLSKDINPNTHDVCSGTCRIDYNISAYPTDVVPLGHVQYVYPGGYFGGITDDRPASFK